MDIQSKSNREWDLILLLLVIVGMLVAAMASAYSNWSAP